MEEQYTLEEWLGMMEEGKLSRLAAGVGLAGAALAGNPDDAAAQQAPAKQEPTKTVSSWTSTMGVNSPTAPAAPKDSTSTQTSRDLQMAVNKAAFDLTRRGIDPRTVAGFKRDIKQNPDGTWSVTMKPDTEKPQMEEQYTLEEWMGKLQEAGVNLNELSPEEIEAQKNSPEAKAKAAERGDRLGFGPNDRISQVGDKQRKRLGQNPHAKKVALANLDSDREQERDSNYVAGKLSYMKKQLQGKRRMAAEAYTIEEWMGKLQEAGVNLNELSPETLASYREKAAAQKSAIKDKYHGTTSPSTGQKYDRDMLGLPPEATAAGDQRKYQKRTAGIAQANQNIGQQAGRAAASGDNSVYSKLNYKDDDLHANAQWQIDRARKSALNQPTGQPKMAAESINENTVARLQSLAGIRPTE